MEWAAAIELTSGILSFITFSVEAFKVARAIGERGSTTENVQISMLTEHLKKAAAKMTEHRGDEGAEGSPVSEHVEAIRHIAIDSEKHCSKLLDLLATLTFTPTEGDSSADRLAKNAKTVIKNIMKKGEVKDLEAAIDKNRAATLLHLQLLLEERQVSIQIELSGLRSQSRTQNEAIAKQIETLGTSVSELAAQLTAQAAVASKATASAEQNISQVLDNQLQMAKAMQQSLGALLKKNATPSPEVRILRGLFFDEIYARKYGVRDAKEATFDWILDEDEKVEEHDGVESDNDKRLRSDAQHRVLSWLRSGNEVFHISGKAGSGKSTLMKLIAGHPRTQSELKLWSEKRHLVVAQFFFWQAGTKLQKSLTGFYRSVLFEILSQCPELIRIVFPSAYNHFNRDDNCLEQIYFQPKSIEAAFHTLLHSTPPTEYCICLFVDGLDEYVGDDGYDDEYGEDGKDREAHQRLAEGLKEWASNGGVKIVASSRPHMEFHSTFSKDQQIHLHHITRRDIFLYALNTIKGSRNFGNIEEYHRNLCLRVVDGADGVFLWAEFAVRVLVRLIVSHATVGPLDDRLKNMLDEKLKDMPRSLSKLYKNILGSLLDSDRQLALKLLLFVTKCPRLNPPNALYFSWLSEWDNPNFPASSGDPYEYDDVEIRQRFDDVDYRLDDLTRGLLHSTPSHTIMSPAEPQIYFTRMVQVYHRTVRDFIQNSSEMRDEIEDVDRQFPSIANGDLWNRLQIAELWFAPNRHYVTTASYSLILSAAYIPGITISNDLLTTFRRVFDYHRRSHGRYRASWQNLAGSMTVRASTMSVDHWAMFVSRDLLAFVVDREEPRSHGGRRGNHDGSEDGSGLSSLSLLLSAAAAGRWTAVRALLRLGHSPEQMLLIRRDERRGGKTWSATVWMIYYAMLSMRLPNNSKARSRVEGISLPFVRLDKENHHLVLEELLDAGRVDPDCHLLLCRRHQDDGGKEHPRDNDGIECNLCKPTHIVSLRQLVTYCDPPNLPRLLEFIDTSAAERRIGASRLTLLPYRVSSAWKYFASMLPETAVPQPNTLFREEDYVPFDYDVDSKDEFLFHSVRCGGVELDLLSSNDDGEIKGNMYVRMY